MGKSWFAGSFPSRHLETPHTLISMTLSWLKIFLWQFIFCCNFQNKENRFLIESGICSGLKYPTLLMRLITRLLIPPSCPQGISCEIPGR